MFLFLNSISLIAYLMAVEPGEWIIRLSPVNIQRGRFSKCIDVAFYAHAHTGSVKP